VPAKITVISKTTLSGYYSPISFDIHYEVAGTKHADTLPPNHASLHAFHAAERKETSLLIVISPFHVPNEISR